MVFNIPKDRFIIIAIILVLMWLGVMGFLYLKADEVTKDPCSICAKRLGEDITCMTNDLNPITRIYYPNYTIENVKS